MAGRNVLYSVADHRHGIAEMRALLALEDGTWFEGRPFGAPVGRTGEICFNTSMTGYQEVLTDPSYRGQIVAMTYPLIGNYGINPLDNESRAPHVRGFVIEELCREPSNHRATESLDAYLRRHGIPGIEGIDTRALTKRLRTAGAMRAILTTEEITPAEACARAAASPPMQGMDYVKEVTTPEAFEWDPDGLDSAEWTIPNPGAGLPVPALGHDVFKALPPVRYRVVAYDFGVKFNILRRLRQAGFAVTVVGARTPAPNVLALNPTASSSPTAPATRRRSTTSTARCGPAGAGADLRICLGNQMLGHAFGGKTFKLKFGHRGGNQPVKDLRSGKISITSQNHGFAVDPGLAARRKSRSPT
jgi:carbamoyl-phosphate synthase small subunit